MKTIKRGKCTINVYVSNEKESEEVYMEGLRQLILDMMKHTEEPNQKKE